MNKKKPISLHEPVFNGNELKYLSQCIKSTWVSTSGYFISKFESKIASYLNVKNAIACNSGTASLHVSLLVCGVKRNDEVIVPTITFIAPINAVRYVGADPIFMDSDEYFNLDEDKTIEFIKNCTVFKKGNTINLKTKKIIRAIILVHTFGNPCKIKKLKSLCKKRCIKIIEDASESLGSKYNKSYLKNQFTGTIGDIGCISFNGNKIITAGAGGMIVTNNNIFAKKIRYLIKQAKDNDFEYIHNEIGYNYSQTNVQAAIGLAQFEKLDKILKWKKSIHNSYSRLLKDNKNFTIYSTPSYSESNYWLNILRIESLKKIDKIKLMKLLIKNGIYVRPIWQLNHLQKEYKLCQNYKITNALALLDRSICLPSSYNLKKNDLKRIVSIINA